MLIPVTKNKKYSVNRLKKISPNKIRDFYSSEIPQEDRSCISALLRRWENMAKPPLFGAKILFNCHLTLTTLFLIEAALRGGAVLVDFTATTDLVVHKKPREFLKSIGVNVYPDGKIPANKKKCFYDICFDCGAGLLKEIIPKIGVVELTHTDPALYTDAEYPVVTVDNSKTKHLETKYGTGDGFVRAFIFTEIAKTQTNCLSQLSQLSSYSERLQDALKLSSKFSVSTIFTTSKIAAEYAQLANKVENDIVSGIKLFFSKKFLIFGYGKVGFGIAKSLISAGVDPSEIYIVEVLPVAYKRAQKNGHKTFLLNELPKNIQLRAIKTVLKKEGIYCVITATGVEGVISKYFASEDFSKIPYLANMGTPDEFGVNFDSGAVLNNKKIFNFTLEYPTATRYFEAICSIYMEAGVELLTKPIFKSGLNNVTKDTDKKVLDFWKKHNSLRKWAHEDFRVEQVKKLLSLTAARNNDDPRCKKKRNYLRKSCSIDVWAKKLAFL
jgi:S-adenosylhomocysteine hydrolase